MGSDVGGILLPVYLSGQQTQTPVTMNTTFKSQDMKMFATAKRNVANIEVFFGERISVEYAKDGFVYFHAMSSMRRFGCKMRGTKVVRTFPVV